jgi:hypothetical protein
LLLIGAANPWESQRCIQIKATQQSICLASDY